MSNLAYRSRQATIDFGARAGGIVIKRLRRGAVQYHFDAQSYLTEVSLHVPRYREMQAAVAEAAAEMDVRRVLDLGIGTGETSASVLEAHPFARVTGVDASPQMLDIAERRLNPTSLDRLVLCKLEAFRPAPGFDLVVSSLAVHHLTSKQKRSLFARIRGALPPGGRFVLADVVRAERAEDAVTPISRTYDRPERACDLERWLRGCGFDVSCQWAYRDLIVLSAKLVPRQRFASYGALTSTSEEES